MTAICATIVIPSGCEADPPTAVDAGVELATDVSSDNADATDVGGDIAVDAVADSASEVGPPIHRPVAVACSAPSPDVASQTCTPMQGDMGDGTCTQSTDCPGGQLCLDTHGFSSSSSCQCKEVGCTQDSDCAAGEMCHCGSVSPTEQTCDGWTRIQCGHRCLPANCRTDADCGPGNFCSPSFDACNWQVAGWYCHDASVDECFTDEQCGQGLVACQHNAALAKWTCEDVLVCD